MKNYKKSLFALALSAFCMGVTEFVMAGVLVDVGCILALMPKQRGILLLYTL